MGVVAKILLSILLYLTRKSYRLLQISTGN